MKSTMITLLCCIFFSNLFSQSIPIEGYVYETSNRGYIEGANISVYKSNGDLFKKVISDRDGFFTFLAPRNLSLKLHVEKVLYDSQTLNFDVPSDDEKYFANIQLFRSPGYLFEVTIAEEKSVDEESAMGLSGYRIDVYNNTKQKEEFVLEEYSQPIFSVPLFKENHYTVLIRKDGYMSKRIEAFVDIEGCILCFEGLGSVGPGVSETLSDNNQIGVLLANVSMSKAYEGKKMQINDIYYDLGKWNLKSESKVELNNLAIMMKDNPRLIVELGSHTDARGSHDNNLILSQKRAKSAVDYLVDEKGISRNRISAKGYGENNLINDCDDSKSCSEIRHLENRRTEIQIIGISKNMRYQSLADIKRSENMDAILKEIQFGDQVMIPVYNAKEDSLLNAKLDSIESSLKILDSLAVEKEKISLINEVSVEEVKDEKAIVTKNIDDERSSLKYEKVVSATTNISEESDLDNKVVNDAELKITSSEDKLNSIQESSDGRDSAIENVQSILDKKIIIKIVLMESEISLPANHDIYKRHKNVSEIYHNRKFKYMMGDFTTMEGAKAFLKNSIKMVYPKAYVVKFN